MLRFEKLSLPVIGLVLTACGASRSPVPLTGSTADVSALTGEWAGDYSSSESGRSGSISFTLRSAGDTAFGDVVMVPTALGRPLMPWRGDNTVSGGANQAPSSTVLT